MARFADVQRLLVEGLEDVAGGATHIGVETPADLEDRLPFVRIARVGGSSDRINDFATVNVDVFAATYTAAQQLAEDVRQYLCGPPPAIALLDRVDCATGPRELPWGDATDVRRWGATYQAVVRLRVS